MSNLACPIFVFLTPTKPSDKVWPSSKGGDGLAAKKRIRKPAPPYISKAGTKVEIVCPITGIKFSHVIRGSGRFPKYHKSVSKFHRAMYCQKQLDNWVKLKRVAAQQGMGL